ncbi:hypothetical protein, partial [Microcoleus sp. Pol12B5]|uniref:hypothetical protein n=1 Tax=Microcoleus sp. Pol12B5 TaxID=3055396 RepID=UPI002FD0CEAE
LPIFFYHNLAQSLLTMGLGRVVTPPGLDHKAIALLFLLNRLSQPLRILPPMNINRTVANINF